jgi:hypothetical protein
VTNRLRDALAGAIFIALGLIFVFGAMDLERGTAFRMGPGYFPLVLAGLLILIGAAVSSFASRRMTPVLAAGITVVLTAFCVLVFNVGLGLPIRLFGPWLS